MNTTIQTQWYNNLENLTNLARYIIDKDGEIDTVDFFRKALEMGTRMGRISKRRNRN